MEPDLYLADVAVDVGGGGEERGACVVGEGG